MLAPIGPGALVLLGTTWLLTLWLGWSLLFGAFPTGIVNSQSGDAASLAERVYFIGFTLSTLGVGDFKPSGEIPMLLTVVAAFNGLVLVTLFITYAVPLVQAVIMRRKVAFTVSLLGANPQEMAWAAWQEGNRQAFEDELQTISEDVMQCCEQRLAYPMLDLFYAKWECFSLGLQVAILDEALSILEFGLQPNYRFRSLNFSKARKVLAHYLRRVELPNEKPHLITPPVSDTDALQKLAVPITNNKVDAFQPLAERRARLHALAHKEGWDWNTVESAGGTWPPTA